MFLRSVLLQLTGYLLLFVCVARDSSKYLGIHSILLEGGFHLFLNIYSLGNIIFQNALVIFYIQIMVKGKYILDHNIVIHTQLSDRY